MSKLTSSQRKRLNQEGYCIVSEYYTRFAPGVEGVTRSNRIIICKNAGFAESTLAYEGMEMLELEPYRLIKGEIDENGYEIGRIEQEVNVLKLEDALRLFPNYEISSID